MAVSRIRITCLVSAACFAAPPLASAQAPQGASSPSPQPAQTAQSTPITSTAPTTPTTPTTQGSPNGQIAQWSMDHPQCAGTLIMPRVMLTAGTCAGRRARGRTYILADGGPARGRLVRYEERIGPIGDIGVMLLDKPITGKAIKGLAALPSYRQEAQALVEGHADLSEGARLVAYGSASAARLVKGTVPVPRRMTEYLRREARGAGGTSVARPLVYRSVAAYREQEPHRVDGKSPQQLFNSLVMRAFYPNRKRRSGDAQALRRGDRELDEMVVLTAGLGSDAAAGIASPLRTQDRGGGVFVLDAAQREWLVGTVLGAQLHARQSEYWPWLFATLLRYNLRAEALRLARQVLGTGHWGDHDRQGNIGDVYVYENPYTRAIEFFRLIALDRHGRYGFFPNARRDNAHWEYLGNDLPSAAEATAPMRAWQPDAREGKVGDVFVRAHPTSGTVEYFRLKIAGGALSEPPIDGASNADWEYLGSNVVV
ncbi:hypothetical protein [Cupriavidus pampae]|uniref:Uncharacterized protein n=1 Tax=Cupriavidus pampae TaxID=659251 RepID=A0ABM8XWB9_9BURK|nr:hypothetical protein [Cupriavidus pampae]CAG9184695.1 hypothetical protein LMG32289_05704 [Cupriavidus pampae]